MAYIDYEKNIFVSRYGVKINLNERRRVMIPRTAGGHTPGWILLSDESLCLCLLEEKSNIPNMVRTKTVRKIELMNFEEGIN